MKIKSFLKRTGSVLVAAALLGSGAVTVLPQMGETTITADAAKSGDFYYEEVSGGVEVWYNGKNSTVSFPSTINGKKVITVSLYFSYPESVKTVNIPASVTKIYTYNYNKNNAISSINVDSGNKTYSSQNGVLFDKNKKELIYYPRYKADKNYTVPSGVTKIDYDAFVSIYLEKVTLPKSVSNIDSDAFEYSSSLKYITVDSGNSNFTSRDGILYSKDMKTGYVLPQANPVSDFTLPDSVESMRGYFFTRCSKLKTVSFGKKVYHIPDLSTATSLTKITVNSDNKYYSTSGGVLFDKEKTLLYCYPVAKVGDVFKVPDTVQTLGANSFGENKNLTGVALSKKLQKVYLTTFMDMKKLTDVAFFNKSTVLDDYLPNQLKKITLHGYSSSTAQSFAKSNSLKFELIKGMEPTSVTINKTSMSLGKDESTQIASVVKPFYAQNRAVTWTSSNNKIATVSAGKVTAKSTGTVNITVKTYNGKSATCKVTAKKAPTSVTLTKGVLTLGVGETYTLGSNVNDGAASAQRTYRTSNSSIVKMTKTEWTGVFKAVKPGVAYVTVRTYNGKEKACKVTVKPAPAWIKPTKSNITLKVGQKASIGSYVPDGTACASRKYSLLTDKGIIKLTKTNWTCEFTALKTGYTTIKVESYNGKTGYCYVNVTK